MPGFDPGAAPAAVYDKGPPAALARHFAAVPGYAEQDRALFWYDWGPVFYRGRLDGSARLLGIASDPGPTERIVGRTLVGDAGQRVQGLLAKVGLTRSYLLVNAFPYAVHPSKVSRAVTLLAEPAHLAWRNRLLDRVTGPALQAIVAFGGPAQAALALWRGAPDVPVFELPHPSDHHADVMLAAWRDALGPLRAAVTPDPDGRQDAAGYGTAFTEQDYGAVPSADLPFGVPRWVGDDSWGRRARPSHRNAASRPPRSSPLVSGSSDPQSAADHLLIWQAPRPG
jgi:hypothetical protein